LSILHIAFKNKLKEMLCHSYWAFWLCFASLFGSVYC